MACISFGTCCTAGEKLGGRNQYVFSPQKNISPNQHNLGWRKAGAGEEFLTSQAESAFVCFFCSCSYMEGENHAAGTRHHRGWLLAHPEKLGFVVQQCPSCMHGACGRFQEVTLVGIRWVFLDTYFLHQKKKNPFLGWYNQLTNIFSWGLEWGGEEMKKRRESVCVFIQSSKEHLLKVTHKNQELFSF